MRYSLRDLCIALAWTWCVTLPSSSLWAQPSDFVGVLTMNMRTEASRDAPAQNVNMQFFLGKERTAIEMGGMDQPVRILLLHDRQEAFMLMHQNGMKIAMPIPGFGRSSDADAADQENEQPEIEVTDTYREIQGYRCRKIIARHDHHRSVQWCSDALGVQAGSMMQALGGQSKQARRATRFDLDALQSQYGFPMYAQVYEKRHGKEVLLSTLEVTDIQRGAPDARHFSMEDYQRFDMGGMGR